MEKFFWRLKTRWSNPDRMIGVALLTFFFVTGLLTIYWRPFVDEADNLVTGWLISQGEVLYRDIFSHHFPFTYYWVAAIIALFGKSIFAVRLSILIFQIFIFSITLKFNKRWVLIGITAVCWGIFRLFYRGNVVLYSSISGPALFAVFVITYSTIRQGAFSKSAIFSIATLSGVAFLSDPLSIYPIAIAYIFLFINNPKKGLLSGLFFSGILGIYLLYLLASGTFTDFWQSAIYFNQVIYNKYTPSAALRIGVFLETTFKGLNLFDTAWLNFNPLYPLSLQSTKFDSWAFTGFFYRLAIIIGSMVLAIRKEFRTAIFTYLFCAAAITISPWEFRAQALILITLFVIVTFCSGDIVPKISNKVITGFLWMLRVAATAAFLLLIIRSSIYLYQNRSQFSYENTFRQLEISGVQIRELGCYSPEVRLISYPGGVYNYWFSGLKPVSRYAYMWPWVAEVGLSEVIEALDQPGILAIAIREESVVWGIYDTRNFLAPLDRYLVDNYYDVGTGIYISPALAKNCDRIQ